MLLSPGMKAWYLREGHKAVISVLKLDMVPTIGGPETLIEQFRFYTGQNSGPHISSSPQAHKCNLIWKWGLTDVISLR